MKNDIQNPTGAEHLFRGITKQQFNPNPVLKSTNFNFMTKNSKTAVNNKLRTLNYNTSLLAAVFQKNLS